MNFWNQLRPLEKRLVVGIGAAVFIVLNAWFVVPHFSDWGKVQQRNADARKKLATYNATLARTNEIEREIRRIEGEGADVPMEDQATHFASAIQTEAIRAGVTLDNSGKLQATTNQNFLELAQQYQVRGKEQQLVDFLYNLGEGNSSIRVRDLNLHPDQPRQMLAATIRLMGSYQLRTPVRGAAPASTRTTSNPAPPKSTPTAAPQKKSTPPASTTAQPRPGGNPAGAQPTRTPGTPPTLPGAGKVGPTNLPRQGPPFTKPGVTNRTANTSKQ
jgi:type II secretory pathway component PulM